MYRTALAAAIGLALSLLISTPTGAQTVTQTVTQTALSGETCDGHPATIVAQPSTSKYKLSTTIGTPGDDVIVGTEGDDIIDGGDGNDIICALLGRDVIRGGAGNDRLFGGLDGTPTDDFFGDRIEPGPGDDYIDLGHDPEGEDVGYYDRNFWDQVSYRDAAGPVTVTLGTDTTFGTATGDGTDTIAPIVFGGGIEGSAFADHLTGTDKEDWIAGGGGDDVIEGLGGDDLIDADRESNYARWRDESPGNDIVNGGAGDDEIHAGFGADVIHGDDGDDIISVLRGHRAQAFGDAGEDYVGGLTGFRVPLGRTTFDGGQGDDTFSMRMKSARDRVTVKGGEGSDLVDYTLYSRVAPARSGVVIDAPAGTFRAAGRRLVLFSDVERHAVFGYGYGEHESLTWYGTAAADSLHVDSFEGPVRAYGRGGDDIIVTSSGNDLLDGGPGRDTLKARGGRDRCLNGEKLKSCERRR